MSIKLNGATNGSVELDVPAAIGSDLSVTIPATAGELTVKATDGSVDLGAIDIAASAPADSVNIDSSGRLLVGTSSSRQFGGASERQVLIESTTGTGLGILRNSNDDTPGILTLGKTRGTSNGSSTIVQNNDYLGIINFVGADGVDANTYGAQIVCQVDGTPGADDLPSRLVFFTTADGASTPTERMRIDSSGSLVLANASAFVAGYIYNTTTGSAANVNVDASGFLRRSTSSIKYKENIQDATHGLTELLQLRPVTYTGKSEADGATVFGGLIAEEVDAVGLSEFVQYAEDGSPDALAYGNMVSLCVKAIQEQQTVIEELQAKVTALETRLTALEGGDS